MSGQGNDLINSPWPQRDVIEPQPTLKVAVNNSGAGSVPSGYLGVTGGVTSGNGRSYLVLENSAGTIRDIYPQRQGVGSSGRCFGVSNGASFIMSQGDYHWIQNGNMCTVTWDFIWTGKSTASGSIALYFDGVMPLVDDASVNPLSNPVLFGQSAAGTDLSFVIAQAANETYSAVLEPVIRLYTINSTTGELTGSQVSASGAKTGARTTGTVTYLCQW
jgi:hypothetical protein